MRRILALLFCAAMFTVVWVWLGPLAATALALLVALIAPKGVKL